MSSRRRRSALILVALASLLVASMAGASPATTPSDIPVRTWVPDGSVSAIVRIGDRIYLGGDFDRLSPRTGPGVALERTSARQVGGWPELAGTVTAVVADGSDGFYVAGTFSQVAGKHRLGLVHLLADGSVDENFDAPVRGTVLALALAQDRLVVGGVFTNVGGEKRRNVASVDAGTGRPLPWGGRVSGPVNAVALSSGRVFVGGDFTRAGTRVRRHLAAFGVRSGRLLAWRADVKVTPHVGLTEHPAHVDALGISGRTLYVGGYFDRVSGKWRTSAAAVDVRSANVRPWKLPLGRASESEPVVTGFAFDARRVYIVGWGGFTGALVGVIAADRGSGKISWRALRSAEVFAIARAGNTVFAGGYDGLLVALDVRTGRRVAWRPPVPNGSVYALAVSQSFVFAGGGFSGIGGVQRSSLAALDAESGEPTAWNPRVDGFVSAMTNVGDKLYIEGYLRRVGGQPRVDRLAAVSATTGAVLPWRPRYDLQVWAVLADANTLFVGGNFRNMGGRPRKGLAAFDVATGALKDWRLDVAPTDSHVSSLSQTGSTVYVAGNFRSIAGVRRPGLAAIDASTGRVLPWTPEIQCCSVGTVVSDEHRVFAASGGTIVALHPRTGARMGTALQLWLPEIYDDSGNLIGPFAGALASVDGVLYVAGRFDSVGGVTRRNAAAVDEETGLVLPWNPRLVVSSGLGAYISTIATWGAEVYVGGGFVRAGNAPQANFALFR